MKYLIILMVPYFAFSEVDITFEENGKKNMPFYSSIKESNFSQKLERKKLLEKKFLKTKESINSLKDTLSYFDRMFDEEKIDQERLKKEYSFALRIIDKRMKKLDAINKDFKQEMGESIYVATDSKTLNTKEIKRKFSKINKVKKTVKIDKKEIKKLKINSLTEDDLIRIEQEKAFEESKGMTFQDMKIKEKVTSFKIKSNTIFSKISLGENRFKLKDNLNSNNLKNKNKISEFFKNLNNLLSKEENNKKLKNIVTEKEIDNKIIKKTRIKEEPKVKIQKPQKEVIIEKEWNDDLIIADPVSF